MDELGQAPRTGHASEDAFLTLHLLLERPLLLLQLLAPLPLALLLALGRTRSRSARRPRPARLAPARAPAPRVLLARPDALVRLVLAERDRAERGRRARRRLERRGGRVVRGERARAEADDERVFVLEQVGVEAADVAVDLRSRSVSEVRDTERGGK